MLRLLLISSLLCLVGAIHAQHSNWEEAGRIEGRYNDVKVDQLNNIYALRKGEIRKIKADGELIAQYSNKLIGNEIYVDVSNPMKVLVFSPNQMQLFFLDSRLGELRQEINLFREGFEQVSLAATSHSNGFWLYDPVEFKLVRFDQNFKKEHESPNLAQLLRVSFYPTDLKEVDNKVYLTDPENGVFVFDIYGNYIKRIPILGVERLKLSNKRLFYTTGNALHALHLVEQTDELVELKQSVTSAYDINKNLICVLADNEILILRPKL